MQYPRLSGKGKNFISHTLSLHRRSNVPQRGNSHVTASSALYGQINSLSNRKWFLARANYSLRYTSICSLQTHKIDEATRISPLCTQCGCISISLRMVLWKIGNCDIISFIIEKATDLISRNTQPLLLTFHTVKSLYKYHRGFSGRTNTHPHSPFGQCIQIYFRPCLTRKCLSKLMHHMLSSMLTDNELVQALAKDAIRALGVPNRHPTTVEVIVMLENRVSIFSTSHTHLLWMTSDYELMVMEPGITVKSVLKPDLSWTVPSNLEISSQSSTETGGNLHGVYMWGLGFSVLCSIDFIQWSYIHPSRSLFVMSNVPSDSDTISMDGKLYDLAIGSDLDGLTDNEIRTELDIISDEEEEDNINVTIKEGIKPNWAEIPPRLASVVVIPGSNKRVVKDLIPLSRKESPSTPNREHNPQIQKNKNRNGSAKRRSSSKSAKYSSNVAGSLITMLSRTSVSEQPPAPPSSTPKRIRSPGTYLAEENSKPAKIFKARVNPTQPQQLNDQTSPPSDVLHRSYSEVARETLSLKICLLEKLPNKGELTTIINFLNDKVIAALEVDSYVPDLKDLEMGQDGLYLKCSDRSSADWLLKIIGENVPGINSKLTIIPQDQSLQVPTAQTTVRVVTCVNSRKPNDIILKTMATFNKNLNTEHWKISSRRYKGATYNTLFMRMDKESYDQIKRQDDNINWTLGSTINISLERNRATPKHNNISSEGNQASVHKKVAQVRKGNQLVAPSSSEVWKRNPEVRNPFLGPSGNSKSNH